MSLLAVHTVDDTLRARLNRALPPHHDLAGAATAEGLSRLVRERPVAATLLDSDLLTQTTGPESATRHLVILRKAYPSVGLVLLFHLGCAGLTDLRLVRTDELPHRLAPEVNQALRWSAASRVTQALSSRMPGRQLPLIRRTFETLHRRLNAEEFARTVGSHRPQLSQRLVASGLPSVGRLLLWGRLLQAAVWLGEPGRTAESVSRQLEYSSGGAFRRMLRTRLNATPSALIAAGGLPFVLDRFLQSCDEDQRAAGLKVG